MNRPKNIDHEDVIRAKVMLFDEGRIPLHREIDALRILAEVEPLTYLPKLSRALQLFGHRMPGENEEVRLSVYAQGVDAARRLDEAEPRRAEVLVGALDAYQRQLYSLGRRADGLAVREEMAEISRRASGTDRWAGTPTGHHCLATAWAEEGRHAEAAREYGRFVEAARTRKERPGKEWPGTDFWSLAEWAAELDAAGRHDAALGAFAELMAVSRSEADERGRGPAALVWELVRYAEMLDVRGRHDEARAARREADGVLGGLVRDGARPGGFEQAQWVLLLGLSGRADERPAAPGAPAPPFGSVSHHWSPDLRRAYVEGRAALEKEAAALAPAAHADPRRHLAGLVRVHRRLTIRSVLCRDMGALPYREPLRPLFDEGVALARRLAELDGERGPAALARALTDRSSLLVAEGSHAEARSGFREAVALLE